MIIYLILGFLMKQEQSGYQIKQHIELGTSNFVRSSYGSIYPALKKLLNKGYLTCEDQINNGRYSKCYSITKEGIAYFMNWLSIPANVASGSHEHLAKMYFYDYLDQQTKMEHFKIYIKQANENIQTLMATEVVAKKTANPNRLSTLYFGVDYYKQIASYYEQQLEKNE